MSDDVTYARIIENVKTIQFSIKERIEGKGIEGKGI